MSSTGPDGQPAQVELRIPADTAYVSVIRTTTAGLAARLDFGIDAIEDLRIAVGEACALVLPEADPGSTLHAEFFLSPGRLTVRVEVSGTDIAAPDLESFAWQVLDTLATSASADVAGDRFCVSLTMEADSLATSR